MAPVAVQCFWSMQVMDARSEGASLRPPANSEARMAMMSRNINTCHVWSEDGDQMSAIAAGRPPEPPLQIVRRFREVYE